MIYRTIVFGHGSVPEGIGYISGHRKGFRAPPAKIWALWAKRGIDQPTRGWCAPIKAEIGGEGKRGREKEGEGFGLPLPSLLPPPSFPFQNLWKGEGRIGEAPK